MAGAEASRFADAAIWMPPEPVRREGWRDALATLPWAKDVKVDFEKKQGTFVAETARYDEAAILKALKDEGFEGKVLR